jgi:predicted dehydrogenase
MAGGRAEAFSDFRRVLERKDIVAVVIATRDHWLMIEAARRHNRVIQVGMQQRSGAHFQRAVKAVQEGRIGEVRFAQV